MGTLTQRRHSGPPQSGGPGISSSGVVCTLSVRASRDSGFAGFARAPE